MASRQYRRSPANRVKSVYVRRYPRFRFGRWENVTDHFRSPPGQLSFDF
ncbi:hypothetical protein [Pseudomonas alvandae]|uniref:DUF1534 domain-containing protein n=1 Tax=Pseudomonas canavaninivorans TaxID=2842348 RepID=A0ABX8QEP6_PSECO|nr:hypothetical protein [Pseudomonas alvandae]QXI53868.1 hypothetical protein KSS97_02620 [Pseudomonas alvandae]